MFRNGYLYQEFTSSKLMTENVCPSLKEVKMFQIDSLSLSSFCDIDENDYTFGSNVKTLKTKKTP